MGIELRPGVKVRDLLKEGCMTAAFFDSDCNGSLDEKEISIFQRSQISVDEKELCITTPDGKVHRLKNIEIPQSDEFYRSGQTKVAVVDDITGFHGRAVSNILKQENPDLSLDRFDNNSRNVLNPFQQFYQRMLQRADQAGILGKIVSNQTGKKVISALDKLILPEDMNLKGIERALDEVKGKIDSGADYKAVNLSCGVDTSYEAINELCKDEIGEEITPENCAKYRTRIKEILRKKCRENKDLKIAQTRYPDSPSSLSEVMQAIEKIEALGIPVYAGASYKNGKQQTFNLFSLADNVRTVESGIENPDGTLNEPYASSSSFAVDENGKRRIAKPVHYSDGVIDYCSTSYATPMVTARELKEQAEKKN